MARLLIRRATGGETLVINDSALPYFPGYIVLETLDDSDDVLPVYLTAAESDFRYAKLADLADPASAETAALLAAVQDADLTVTGAWNFTGATVTGLDPADVTGLQATLDAKAPLTTTQSSQAGSGYTFVLGDANTLVETTNSAAVTLTVPPNSAVAFPVGTSISVRQYGAGQVTLTPAAGVNLRSRGGALKAAGQYAELTMTQRAVDEWVVSGDLTT